MPKERAIQINIFTQRNFWLLIKLMIFGFLIGFFISSAHGGSLQCLPILPGSLPKGCVEQRDSDTLILYFRGWNRSYASPGNLAQKYWQQSAQDLFNKPPYALASLNLRSSVFATGSSHLHLSAEEIRSLMAKTGASRLILAGHSGGNIGLEKTIRSMPQDLAEKVSGVQMLDNFYGVATMKKALRAKFDDSFLKENCRGFVTPSDNKLANYNREFKDLCPLVDQYKRGHEDHVRCMAHYESGVSCDQPVPAQRQVSPMPVNQLPDAATGRESPNAVKVEF